jgi:hypothetical protein
MIFLRILLILSKILPVVIKPSVIDGKPLIWVLLFATDTTLIIEGYAGELLNSWCFSSELRNKTKLKTSGIDILQMKCCFLGWHSPAGES